MQYIDLNFKITSVFQLYHKIQSAVHVNAE
jgi:hypothetical protein